MLEATCLCGTVRSRTDASNLFIPAEGLRFTRGEELRSFYKVPDAQFFTQTFCSVSGSKMPRKSAERGTAAIPMGSLDDDPGFRVQSHIFVAFKAPWFEIRDGRPQFNEYPL